MTAQRYQAIFDWFRARPAALRALGYAQKISVLGVYLVYGAVLAVTLWQRSGQFWRVLAVPAAVYVWARCCARPSTARVRMRH